MKILVTAAAAPAGRATVELLRADGRCEVVAADPKGEDCVQLPMAEAPGYLDALQHILEYVDWAVIACDAELRMIIGHEVTGACPDHTLINALDKYRLYCCLPNIAPQAWRGCDLWIKTRTWPRTYSTPLAERDIITERLPGPEFSIDALYWHGREIASVVRERLETTNRGICSVAQVYHEHPAADVMRTVNDSLPLHGIVNIQCRTHQDGRLLLTDLNARPGGGIGLSAQAGVDLPALLVDMLLYDEPRGNATPQTGRYKQESHKTTR